MKQLRFRKFAIGSAVVVVSLGIGCGAYAGYLQLTGNFHTVIEGQLYRSAQPSAASLSGYIKAHGIKTVINLRGAHPKTPWYDAEVAVSEDLGVKHIDFGMSDSKMFSPEKADELVAVMASAPKPILIHCQAGADRSGLAAALYEKEVAGQSSAKAEGQLSFYYGHVGIPVLSRAYAMDRSWKELEARDKGDANTSAVSAEIAH